MRCLHRFVFNQWMDIISDPLFADADTGIYPHAASQYHARPKAKRGIAMLRVDKFPYPREHTRGNEFIPCSNNICDILKRFRSFKIPAITLIWLKSSYKHSVIRSYRSGKESGRDGIAIVASSMTFLCLYISRWWRQTWDTAPYFTVVNQSEARISTEHGINMHIRCICNMNWIFVAITPVSCLTPARFVWFGGGASQILSRLFRNQTIATSIENVVFTSEPILSVEQGWPNSVTSIVK